MVMVFKLCTYMLFYLHMQDTEDFIGEVKPTAEGVLLVCMVCERGIWLLNSLSLCSFLCKIQLLNSLSSAHQSQDVLYKNMC
jgi:hypothetical protein